MRDLFFAALARLKFLKMARTETEIAVEVFRRLALANPHVAFRLRVEAREVLSVLVQFPRRAGRRGWGPRGRTSGSPIFSRPRPRGCRRPGRWP